MSSYVRSLRHEIPFDGETVTATLRPLLFGDLLRLRAAMTAGEDDYMRLACELLPTYVEDLKGPVDAAGSQVPAEEVSKVAFFAPIVFSCANRLIEAARLPNSPPSGKAVTVTSPDGIPNSQSPSAG